MTVALAIIFVALLMIYCGIKGRSFKHALTGQSVLGGDGQFITSAASTGSSGSGSSSAATGKAGTAPKTGTSRGEGGPHR